MSWVKILLQKQRLKRIIKRAIKNADSMSGVPEHGKERFKDSLYQFAEILGVPMRTIPREVYSPVIFYRGLLTRSERGVLYINGRRYAETYLEKIRVNIAMNFPFIIDHSIIRTCIRELGEFSSMNSGDAVLPRVCIDDTFIESIESGSVNSRIKGLTPYRHKAKTKLPEQQESEFVRFLKENKGGVRTIVFKGD